MVTRRVQVGKHVEQLRRAGVLPGGVYGYGVKESLPVQVDRREFERVYRHVGATTLIDLRVDGGTATKVFVHKVTRTPVGHVLNHVDFMAVNLDEPITADVSIVLMGESPAVRAGEALVVRGLATLHVRALPARLPSDIPVDLSRLTEVGQTLLVRDLALPADVEVLSDLESTVVHISAMQAVREEEEAAVEAAEAEAEETATEAAENAGA